MRLIAIVAAIFLVVVAAASGSSQKAASGAVTQTALEAPQPATAHVACSSTGTCVAIGGSDVLVERAGKWKAVRVPLPPQPGKGASVTLLSLACPSSGTCVASGLYGERRAVVLTQRGTKWGLAVATLPGSPADPSFPALPSVSCAAAGNCAAVGSYQFPLDTPVVVWERDGAWATDDGTPLPANAATSRDPDHAEAGGGLSLVSCPSVGPAGCTAAGTYTNKDAQYSEYGWFLNGTAAASVAQLPAGASVSGNQERSGTSPFLGFTGLSCASPGTCTAVGGYVDRRDDLQGVIFTERGGSWSRGVKAPTPRNAGLDTAAPNSFENPLSSLACAAQNDCTATGWYVDKSKHRRGLLLTERNGKWRASELVLPAGAPRNAVANLGFVTCASRGRCVAVGDYASGGKTYGLIVVERAGKWSRGIKAALPANHSRTAHTFVNSVSCPSASRCTAVGDYADRSARARGLIVRLRLG